MYYMFHTYLDVLIAAVASIGLCFLLFGIAYSISDSNMGVEKLTGYECGFDPFSDARDPFNIKFYLVSILFLIFDVEMIFFYPGIVSLRYIGGKMGLEVHENEGLSNASHYFGFFTMYVFVSILILGSFYEYRKKALDWHE